MPTQNTVNNAGGGGGGAVDSVFSRTGAVVAASGDYTASQITNVPAGSIAATDVQAAITELDSEKQPVNAGLTQLAALTDPGADRILFWDESANAYAYLTVGSNLSITGTTINASGGGGGGNVDSVIAGTGISVDNTDPANPIVASTITQYTNELAQDAVGGIVDATLVYDDVTPALKRAPITGDITIADGSNTAAIGAGVIINADINASAAIDATKIADGSVTSTEFQYLGGVTSDIQAQFSGKQATGNYITALTGDITASGPGSVAATLATVNSNVGSFGSSTSIPSFTVNGKGLITAASGNAVVAPAGTLTGTTLAAGVVTSSLTTVGTITSGTWNGTDISLADGGTGASLTDPNADRILFWDDSAGAMTWLTVGTGLSITGTTISTTGGAGDVVGPASATDNALVRYDSTTGKLIQNSNATLSDAGSLSMANGQTISIGDGGILSLGGGTTAPEIRLANEAGGNTLKFVHSGGGGAVTETLDINFGASSNTSRSLIMGGSITTAGDFTTAGAFAQTLTATGATNVTLPTTGTLATLAGTETLTNKSLSGTTNITGATPILKLVTSGTAPELQIEAAVAGVNTLKIQNTGTGTAAVSTLQINLGSSTATRGLVLSGGGISIGGSGSFTTTGTGGINLASTSTTNVTLPTTGTLATLAGTETFTGKTLTNPVLTNGNETTQTLTDGATVNWNMNSGGFATLTLGGNRTMAAPTNLKNGASYVLILNQDASAPRTVTWNSVFKWAGGIAPTLSTTNNAKDILTFISDGTNLYGVAQKAFA